MVITTKYSKSTKEEIFLIFNSFPIFVCFAPFVVKNIFAQLLRPDEEQLESFRKLRKQ
jgi:hypothetical protein